MKIPGRVRIDRREYTVVYADPKKIRGAEKDAIGHCSPKERKITLCPSLRREEYERLWVFWHEIGHAWEHEYGLTLNHHQIDHLGRALALFCLDNDLDFRGKNENPAPR